MRERENPVSLISRKKSGAWKISHPYLFSGLVDPVHGCRRHDGPQKACGEGFKQFVLFERPVYVLVRKLHEEIHRLVIKVILSLVRDVNEDCCVVRIQNRIEVWRSRPDKADMENDAVEDPCVLVKTKRGGFVPERFKVEKSRQPADG